LISPEEFKELRKELILEIEKSIARDSISIFLNGEELLFIPPHSIKHDEWGTAELSWALAKTLGSGAVIPTRDWSESDERFIFDKLGKLKFKMLVELGGWKKESIGVISNNLDIMKNVIFFLKRWYPISSTKFHTQVSKKYLYDYQISYLRLEIPKNIRSSFSESLRLFVILHSLFFKLKQLNFKPLNEDIQSPNTKCVLCKLQPAESNVLNLPVCIDCLFLMDIWTIAKDIGDNKFNNEVKDFKNYLRSRKRHKPICLICGRTFYSDLPIPICNDDVPRIDIQPILLELATNLIDFDKIKKQITKSFEKSDKRQSILQTSFHMAIKIDMNLYNCVNCGSSIQHNNINLLRVRLCGSCSKRFDLIRLFNEIGERIITFSNFIHDSSIRRAYLIPDPSVIQDNVSPIFSFGDWRLSSAESTPVESTADTY